VDKIVDALYKKILILLAIAGGSWVYAVEFLEKEVYFASIFLFLVFIFVGMIIIKNYVQMNILIKRMIDDENVG
jgi:membrane protein YdbS with pleckstrin-like domain